VVDGMDVDTIICGDSLTELQRLPDESVHCCVTSPPYWGLRDYGTATWEGGDEGCDHIAPPSGGRGSSTLVGWSGTPGEQEEYAKKMDSTVQYRDTCGKCGAHRIDDQLGLEPTPDEYVAKMVAIFREVRRVLRGDGTLWLNLGDSYASSTKGDNRTPEQLATTSGLMRDGRKEETRQKSMVNNKAMDTSQRPKVDLRKSNLKPKDLCGIPWRVAFALQADGWYLRQDIIWHKPNPMPESVTDRCTKAHEYLFLLSKAGRYYYDADAVREPAEYGRRVWSDVEANLASATTANDKRENHGVRRKATVSGSDPSAGRNLRSVWTIPTKPYKGAHFAVFPPKLIEPCIKAGTSEEGCCAKCGAPWLRVVERERYAPETCNAGERNVDASRGDSTRKLSGPEFNKLPPPVTTGWQPGCECQAGKTRCIVLDPFFGAGTTGMVAKRMGCHYVGIELNPDYCEIAANRLRQKVLF